MAYTFDQSKDEIARLVQHFTTQRAAYFASSYKEAHARQEFIDPLFEALNWDVHNRRRSAPDYREVVLEDTLEVQGQKRSPDYAFRVGRERKFFAEAKKPGVDIKADIAPSYQLRRYAWSAHLPLSVLTDFEEFAVYDCRVRPKASDKTAIARVTYLQCDEYPDRWQEVWDIFSRDAVWAGSFDQFAQAGKGKRGTSEVDIEFLKEIEGWRDVLARNIALRNPHLTIDELNDLVQRTIDRIIFLRMAEDRGMEDYGRLQRLAQSPNIYAELLSLYRLADAKYNSGLFDFSRAGDLLTPGLIVDDKTLRPILTDLYYPQSPYEFSVLPVEILGNVYERFLGKVIRLTPSHQARVEDKPEVKKAGGVYYTPAYIVEYIVRHTVGKQIEGRSPRQLRGFRVLDMACGSGSFLLGAYQYLLDYYRQWYANHEPEKHPNVMVQVDGEWRLLTTEKKRILAEHIFGVDIDHQAVEVTKLSLLLKVLEGEDDETLNKQLTFLQERALPNLDRNIKCGNSLVGPDYFAGMLLPDPGDLRQVNPFDWATEFPQAMAAGGFDCIIGNPPYIRIQTLQETNPAQAAHLKARYRAAASGNYDIYVVFVEKGLGLLNEDGRLGFILPHKFFNAQYGQPLRQVLSEGQHLAKVVHFGDQQVFENATTYTCLMFLDKTGREEFEFERVNDLAAWRLDPGAAECCTVGVLAAPEPGAVEWNFVVGQGAALFERLSRMPVKLGDVAEKLAQGIRTSANEVYVLDVKSDDGGLVKAYSRQLDRDVVIERDALALFLQGREIKSYRIMPSGKVVLVPYRSTDGRMELISEREIRERFPRAYAYLVENKKYLEGRERGRMKGSKWYGYIYPKNLEIMYSPKILVPDIADRASFALDESGEYAFTSGYGITIRDGVRESPKYILGLLNSHLVTFYLRHITTPLQSGFFRYFAQYLSPLPIRSIDFSDPADKARHDQMVRLVDAMLELHKRKAGAADAAEQGRLQRLIDATDQQINNLVYALFELTAEEIALVE